MSFDCFFPALICLQMDAGLGRVNALENHELGR
jgi:hypothetical protein